MMTNVNPNESDVHETRALVEHLEEWVDYATEKMASFLKMWKETADQVLQLEPSVANDKPEMMARLGKLRLCTIQMEQMARVRVIQKKQVTEEQLNSVEEALGLTQHEVLPVGNDQPIIELDYNHQSMVSSIFEPKVIIEENQIEETRTDPIKMYSCPHPNCDKKYATSRSLKRHLKSRHTLSDNSSHLSKKSSPLSLLTLPKTIQKKKKNKSRTSSIHPCLHCLDAFLTTKQLKLHISNTHAK